jgi:N-acyl-D-aspartate/D-glutamate deacylase
MSGLAANIVGITNRGVLSSGNKADILVISSAGVHNRATWVKPMLPPTGFDVIIVNGEIALQGGRPDTHLHGQVLRRVSNQN